MCEACGNSEVVHLSVLSRRTPKAKPPLLPEPKLPDFEQLTPEEFRNAVRGTLEYAELQALQDYMNMVANRRAKAETVQRFRETYSIALRALEDLRQEFAPRETEPEEIKTPLPDWFVRSFAEAPLGNESTSRGPD